MAIYFKAFLALTSRFVKQIFIPILDAILIYAGYFSLLPYWENLKYEVGYYPPEYMNYMVPAYTIIWVLAILIAGGYQRPVKLPKIISGLFWGTLSILVLYSLVSENLRFSRALILLGSAWAFAILLIYRIILSRFKLKLFQLDIDRKKRIAIVANPEEANRINELINRTKLKIELVGLVTPDDTIQEKRYIGSIRQVQEIVKINRIDELIFSSVNMSSRKIINTMLQLTSMNVDYKIAPPESVSIIGSNSIDTAGDLYVLQINSITKESNKRDKRLLDVFLALCFLLSFPLVVWTIKSRTHFFANIIAVLAGKKSWVGYSKTSSPHHDLPAIREGIISPFDNFSSTLSETKKEELNILYAKDYRLLNDLKYIYQSWQKLGRK